MAWEQPDRFPNLVRTVFGSLITVAFAWFIASFVPVYEVVAHEDADGGAWRYLSIAQVVGWGGIAGSVIWAVTVMVRKARAHRPIAWTPLIAVPLIIESWVAGFLVAVVLAAI